jgi:hypothetical protein
MQQTVLILEGNSMNAWAMNTALLAGLHGRSEEIQILVCTTKDEHKTPPDMYTLVQYIEEADLILLSEDLWCYKNTDFTPYLKGKHVIATSPLRINGFNHFNGKSSLLKVRECPEYMDASVNLCNLVRAGLETRLKLRA